jgi:hypothetical protein
MAGANSLPAFCASFLRLVQREDGAGIVRQFELVAEYRSWSKVETSPRLESVPQAHLQNAAVEHGGEVYGEVLSLYLSSIRQRALGQSLQELELACTCLKTWVQRYIECDGPAEWMTTVMTYLSIMTRNVATQLDLAKRSENTADAYLKKLVEIHRELFQKLNKERAKRAGYVWVCCELLRAYFKLGQISQCSFLLSALNQNLNKDGFNPTDLPKAISVTFYFYWGKHCVFDHNLRDADEKLTWAFNHCPAKSKGNRRKILLYLIPCKMRLGVLPTQDLLKSHGLDMFVDIVSAIREGNVKLFTEKMEEYAADFIKMGTYILMMKLKFMVMRNLCKGVHHVVRKNLGEKAGTKLDLQPFEHVFQWQDGCDADETACVLSNLIHQGAVKGYLSHEHRKLVFAKDMPFPPATKWKL